MKNKFTLFVVLAIIIVAILAIVYVFTLQTPAQSSTTKIGAILALSGPSTVWGESMKNGMELALQNHPELEVIYEDSKGTAADGISAYQKMKIQDVDVYVTSLSIVSVPLAKLAKDDKKGVVITQSAANNITNEYAYRYYTDANHFALPSFQNPISPLKNASRLAVIYRKDEYAQSVDEKIQELAAEQGKQVVFNESYTPNETDFSTILTKAQETNPDALLFVPTPPSESLALLKKVQELDFNIPIVEVSNVQSDPETQAKSPNITFYTNQFAFSTPGNSEDFKQNYRAKYNKEPNFMSAFGYDIVNLIASCDGQQIKQCLDSKTEVSGVTGTAVGITNHDILIPMDLVKVH